ncbi:Pentafunctional arom polypeptide [Mycena venus]|uniref:Pentafunctional arom polypeptide n=1 Tax=Mycena venus TaxID=2733690 RepID=A0A8H6XPB5_9AGAR|nr:Pentafunctional arom polypeptide [Mycena venus]
MAAPPSKKYYLFGYPIAHSSAPALHNHCFKSLGTESTYTIWSTSKVTEEMLAVIHSDDCGGAAVTMPNKTAIIPFLDELSPESRITNACNTIVKIPTANGGVKLVGQNTDILGVRNALLSALKEQHPNRPIPTDASAAYPSHGSFAGLVIGGGATTRSAAHALTLLGLAPIFLINRDVDEVRAVMDAMPHLSSKGGLIHLRDPADVETHLVGEGKARILMAVGCIPSFAPQTLAERMVYTTASAVFTVPYVVPTVDSPRSPVPHTASLPRNAETIMYKVAAAHGWYVIDGIEAMIEQGFAQQRMWLRGVASVAVGSDSSITGVALEQSARKSTRERLTAPSAATTEAIKLEVDRAEGKASAVLPKK